MVVGVDKENLYMMTELERWERWNQGVGVGADPALCPTQRNGLRENDMRQRQRQREGKNKQSIRYYLLTYYEYIHGC